MTGLGFLDVDTETVVWAGRATADTADDWASWGDRSKTVFRNAEVDASSEKIFAAIEEYAGDVVSEAHRVGQRVSNLGVVTTSAGHLVDNADVESAALLRQHTSVLPRPVDGARVPV